MAKEKSIIEEALLEAEKINATFKTNAKEILAQTMSSEIEEMVKESLTGSKRSLKEEDEENNETELDLDTEMEGGEGEEEMELDLDTEMGEEGEEEMELDLGTEMGDEEEAGEEMEEPTEMEGEDMDLSDLDLGTEMGTEMGDMETVDLTKHSDNDVISVFKKMGPEDEIEVVQDGDTVTLKDNKSGSEYKIELQHGTEVADVDMEMTEGTEDSDQVIYEIVVDETWDHMDDEEDYMYDHMTYDESGLDHPEKADLNDDHDISSYEKKRGMAIQKSMKKDHMSYMDNMNYMHDKNMEEDYMDYMEDENEEEVEEGRMPRTLGKAAQLPNRRSSDINDNRSKMRYESKTPQISKLINENTSLNEKNSALEVENTELKENQEKMVDALKQFRKKLQEVAVFNSNLTYAVRLFTENTTTKEEKQEILKRLDSAKDLKESQLIYKQLVKEYSNSKTPIKESIDEKINKTASSGAQTQISEQSVFVHPELQNMKKLWEYNFKK